MSGIISFCCYSWSSFCLLIWTIFSYFCMTVSWNRVWPLTYVVCWVCEWLFSFSLGTQANRQYHRTHLRIPYHLLPCLINLLNLIRPFHHSGPRIIHLPSRFINLLQIIDPQNLLLRVIHCPQTLQRPHRNLTLHQDLNRPPYCPNFLLALPDPPRQIPQHLPLQSFPPHRQSFTDLSKGHRSCLLWDSVCPSLFKSL